MLDDPVRRNRYLEDQSRQAWMQREGLHPRRPAALPGERMDLGVEKQWNDWLTTSINIALRAHAKQTQTFVCDLLRENNRNLMKIINGLRSEIDQLRKQLSEQSDA